jgi:hypothetical protein
VFADSQRLTGSLRSDLFNLSDPFVGCSVV